MDTRFTHLQLVVHLRLFQVVKLNTWWSRVVVVGELTEVEVEVRVVCSPEH
jgi:hypothetical protein